MDGHRRGHALESSAGTIEVDRGGGDERGAQNKCGRTEGIRRMILISISDAGKRKPWEVKEVRDRE